MALTQNQGRFLEALRLFIELGIPDNAVDGEKGNPEQRLFVSALHWAQGNPLFAFPPTPNREKLKGIFVELAQKEAQDCTGTAEEKEGCRRAVEITAQGPCDAFVVHGVHQFSPVQLRLLAEMEKLGFTVIFLFNYQKEYAEMYASWREIYSCFEAPVHHDTAVPSYRPPAGQNPSHALACALGALCKGRQAGDAAQLRRWYQGYKDVPFVQFANVTEYAHFISRHFDAAVQKYAAVRGGPEQGGVWSNAAVLRHMDEQVYTANRDVHALLRIYYPAYAGERHFLSYPIGQFFSAIYRLWDYARGEIRFDIPAVKECLSSGILRAAPGENLLRAFCHGEILFARIETYEDFRRQVAEPYPKNYEKILSAAQGDPLFPLQRLAIYNPDTLSKKDVGTLIKAIEEINDIARYLFAFDNSREDFIDFGKHFEKLEAFLKRREPALANEQERALITALQLRLDAIKPERSAFSGTFRDLREGLYYYLKQKEDADEGPDWIVKNFEQIDGDILQSKGQFERGENKVYHFACLSDRDMNRSVNDQLPWPLTESFIRAAYTPVDLPFQVYYTALSERCGFLRYALFYGLCYNCGGLRLSFVRQYGDQTAEPYALLPILGLQPKAAPDREAAAAAPLTLSVERRPVETIPYVRAQMMDMFLCPYRYFLDYVVEDGPVIQGDFLCRKYYENLLIEAVWKRIAGKPREAVLERLSALVDEESRALEPYFTFWKQTEIYDLKLRAGNYLLHSVVTAGSGPQVRAYAPSHMQMRRLFGKAKFMVDISEIERKNPYGSFEALARRKYPLKEYSLHRLPKPEVSPKSRPLAKSLCDAARQYINQPQRDRAAIPSDWCAYCVHKGTCMEPFLAGTE